MKLLAGVDGGGSKTLALIANGQGRIIGKGLAGPSNPNVVGIKVSVKNIKSALIEALGGYQSKRINVAVFGVAGSEARDELSERLSKTIDFVEEIEVVNDSFICLAAGTQGRPGVVVIAGTGSIILAVDEEGKVIRAGGWGYLLEDSGSALQLGRKAAIETLRFLEKRAPSSKLVEKVLKKLNAKSVNDLLSSIYNSDSPISKIASLAPLVVELSEEGDLVAKRIVNEAIDELVSCVLSVISRSRFSSRHIPVVLSGGVFRGSSTYLNAFKLKLRKIMPRVEPMLLELEPAIGALILAFKKAGLLNNEVLFALIESYRKMEV